MSDRAVKVVTIILLSLYARKPSTPCCTLPSAGRTFRSPACSDSLSLQTSPPARRRLPMLTASTAGSKLDPGGELVLVIGHRHRAGQPSRPDSHKSVLACMAAILAILVFLKSGGGMEHHFLQISDQTTVFAI